MPTIEENKQMWEDGYEWKLSGEEWSNIFGGSEAQWFGSIYPRIHAFIPAGTILEIAPGFGRWTQYLKEHCEHLIVVDLAEKCIQACQERFASESHISFFLNDGKSLSMIEDKSIDFVFSYDSLVHAETEVIEAYLNQLAEKLKTDGIGFIHHSNLGRYRRALSFIEKIPVDLRDQILNNAYLSSTHWRAPSMSARLFEEICNHSGLECIGQELINWGDLLTDCFSLITLKNSKWSRPNLVVRNPEFGLEAPLIHKLAPLYTTKSFDKQYQ